MELKVIGFLFVTFTFLSNVTSAAKLNLAVLRSGSGSLTGSDGTINDREKRGTSNGCVYNDNVYQEGAVWTDGCEAECKCLDSSTGHYECTELCPYVDVPSECHMEPPVAGNCCKLLSCPPGSKK